MLDLNYLSKISYEISKQRQNNGAFKETTTASLLKHTATEVVEASEAFDKFQFAINSEFALGDYFDGFTSELADIIVCVLIIAGKENVDIEKAVLDCMEKNRKRAEGIGDKL